MAAILAPGFYITSYTQLTTNGVQKPPDAYDWDPRELLEWLCLKIGEHQLSIDVTKVRQRPEQFRDVCHFFAWRGFIWRDEYDLFNLDPTDTLAALERALQREESALPTWDDQRLAENERKKLYATYGILKNLFGQRLDPKFADLNRMQQDFVIREFCTTTINGWSAGIGDFRDYPIGPPPAGYDPNKPETDTRPKRKIKCVYSSSLADMCYNAFDCVVIDEGVKMKGEETLVGKGVRSLTPAYRLVLTATPIKNRLPDVFRLAWWATGGKSEAHARWPYRDDSSERTKFAQTFMVSERNLTREAKAKQSGKRGASGRFTKLTAEVCNLHRLWKLFGPIILRRRKQDAGVDIVPKVRKVIRCEMGTHQEKVYQYHLEAGYRDVNGNPAIGAQLQALRIAAAHPSSSLLTRQPGEPFERCECAIAGSEPVHRCHLCRGSGAIPLPHRSGTDYIPKMATVLTLIEEVMARKEQVIVFSAFHDPLDSLSRWLSEAGVRHVTLDGRVSQKKRGEKAALFKKGRGEECSVPVMLAGVEGMAEGHSVHLANNVVLLAYSWAADKFKQALDRVHRLNSVRAVNIYVLLCQGTIDRRLESLTNEKTDACELVLDGRLIGERPEEVNLAELLKVARREFNAKDNTLDEALLQTEWPKLRDRLSAAMRAWEPTIEMPTEVRPRTTSRAVPELLVSQAPALLPPTLGREPLRSCMNKPETRTNNLKPELKRIIAFPVQVLAPNWKERLRLRADRLNRMQKPDALSRH